jgi:hypothetical protein
MVSNSKQKGNNIFFIVNYLSFILKHKNAAAIIEHPPKTIESIA